MKRRFAIYIIMTMCMVVLVGCGSSNYKSNEIESNEIESNEIESNEIESNEIGSNEIESNEIGSNEIESSKIESSENASMQSNENVMFKYALLLAGEKGSETADIVKAATEKASEINVHLDVFYGNMDYETQNSVLLDIGNVKYDGVIIEPVYISETQDLLRKLKKAGTSILIVDKKGFDDDLPDAYIGRFNEIEAAKKQMQKTCELINGKGNIAIIRGSMATDYEVIRSKAYNEALKSYPDIKIVYNESGNWKEDEAKKLTKDWIDNNGNIQAIVAQNEEMAIGAAKMVKKMELEEIIVTGFGANDAVKKAISEGLIDGAVSLNSAEIGAVSVQAAFDISNNNSPERDIYIQPTWIK